MLLTSLKHLIALELLSIQVLYIMEIEISRDKTLLLHGRTPLMDLKEIKIL